MSVIDDGIEYIFKGDLRMKTKFGQGFTWVICLGVMLLLITACGKPKMPMGGAPEVAVVTLQEERVPIITELPGRTSAFLIAEVRPQVSGIIQKRLFTEGSDVKAGDLLYQIDPSTYEAAYSAAKAALARAEANVVTVRNRASRYKELVAIKAVSQQDYDDVTAALKQAEADVESSKASAENARINLAYTRVTAPISGRVGKSHVTVGALATAHQIIPFTTIQQIDPVYVDVTKSSADLLELKNHIAAGRVKTGGNDQAKVKLVLEDGTPYPLEGTLKFSDITVEPSTGSVILRMVFPNPGHILLPGMYARAFIQEGVIERGIIAPQQGVSRDPKGNPIALVVDTSNKVELRALKVDRAIGDKWLVTEGLKAGDRLIVEGLQKIKPGVPVKIVPFDASPQNATEAAKPAQAQAPAKTK